MKTFATYKMGSVRLEILGRVEVGEAGQYIGLISMAINGGSAGNVIIVDSIAISLEEAWTILNIEADKLIDFGFVRIL